MYFGEYGSAPEQNTHPSLLCMIIMSLSPSEAKRMYKSEGEKMTFRDILFFRSPFSLSAAHYFFFAFFLPNTLVRERLQYIWKTIMKSFYDNDGRLNHRWWLEIWSKIYDILLTKRRGHTGEISVQIKWSDVYKEQQRADLKSLKGPSVEKLIYLYLQ